MRQSEGLDNHITPLCLGNNWFGRLVKLKKTINAKLIKPPVKGATQDNEPTVLSLLRQLAKPTARQYSASYAKLLFKPS